MTHDIESEFKQIAETVRSSVVGPTLAAAKVLKLAAEWDEKYAEQRKMSVETFMRRFFSRGQTVAYFKRRHAAHKRFETFAKGSSVIVDHFALVWLDKNLPITNNNDTSNLVRLLQAIRVEYTAQAQQPLSLAAAKRVYESALGYKPRSKKPPTCPNCARLQNEVNQLKAMVNRKK